MGYIFDMMNRNNECARWVQCPVCGRKTRTKVYVDTVVINFPVFCPKCKKEVIVNIVNLKMVICK